MSNGYVTAKEDGKCKMDDRVANDDVFKINREGSKVIEDIKKEKKKFTKLHNYKRTVDKNCSYWRNIEREKKKRKKILSDGWCKIWKKILWD